jgi:3-oxoacyl-[acyl-carrier-protein] synthase-3
MEAQFRSRIESIGNALPKKKLMTKDLVDSCRHKIDVDMEELTGIHERRVCSEEENSFTLARDAALDCLTHSGHKASDLGLLINCSISKFDKGLSHRYEPPLSLYITEAIGAHEAMNFDIQNACAGMLTGIYLLDNYIRLGIVDRGMVVSGEDITSLSTNAARTIRTIASKQMASLTVGDAGAAAIVERAPPASKGIKVSEFTTLSKHSDLCFGRPCKDAPGATMSTEARKIHRVAIEDSPPILKRALDRSGLSFDEIDHVIPHQTSARSIKSGARRISEKFGVKPKNVIINLHDFGNTASTTHFVALYKYLNEGLFKKGENIMLICFASGLVVGVVIFTMDELVDKYNKEKGNN